MGSVKTMSKTLWKVLVICSISIACVQKKLLSIEVKPTSVRFNNFVCTDLSEDQAQLSTHDDEIVVVYGLLYVNKSNTVLSTDLIVKPLTKVVKHVKIDLNKSYTINNEKTPLLFIGLIEVDDKINSKTILTNFETNITSSAISKTNEIWRKNIDDSKTSNDDLGYVLQQLTIGNNTYLIAGDQLTDRYEYRFDVIIK